MRRITREKTTTTNNKKKTVSTKRDNINREAAYEEIEQNIKDIESKIESRKKKTMMTFGRKLIQNQSIMVFLKKLITFFKKLIRSLFQQHL